VAKRTPCLALAFVESHLINEGKEHMGRLEPGGFSSSGAGLPLDRPVEPEREVEPEQVETDRAIWPKLGQVDPT
jgi:hypothetical protein